MVKEVSKEDMENGAWEWVPNVRIGPFEFARPMTDFIEKLGLRLETDDAIPGLEPTDYYAIPGFDKTAYEEDGLFETIISRDVVIYRGVNLIGVTESEMIELINQDPSEIDEIDLADEEDGAPYRVFTFDDLGLQVWSLEDRVDSVTCWRDEGEEEEDGLET